MLEETERIFSCPYCRVKLALACKDYFRYFLAPRIPDLPGLFYVPYWRHRGILFFFESDGRIRHRVIDSNSRATAAAFLPRSLGVRPQALKLQFVTPSTIGRFCKPNFRLDQVEAHISNRYDLISNSPLADFFHAAVLGETLSLIYSPVTVQDNVLYDAILDRPVAKVPEAAIRRLENSAQPSDSLERMRFVAALCPQCGWDLQGDKDTLVLFCSNCDLCWALSNEGLTRLAASISGEAKDADLLLPFWRILVGAEGIDLDTYAGLVQLANLPRIVAGPAAHRRLYFWIPAFKLNPRLFLRLARLMMLAQPEEGSAIKRSKLPFYPVTLPVKEAAAAIRVIIADLCVPKRQILVRFAGVKTKSVEESLTYFPFTVRGSEVIHDEMQISLNRNALELGRLI